MKKLALLFPQTLANITCNYHLTISEKESFNYEVKWYKFIREKFFWGVISYTHTFCYLWNLYYMLPVMRGEGYTTKDPSMHAHLITE